jgi:7,8-dihydropterin-6-yl-methyl-4-(beta-D-ribofuranosyl)aminobenzene 5'-phosphate synthase
MLARLVCSALSAALCVSLCSCGPKRGEEREADVGPGSGAGASSRSNDQDRSRMNCSITILYDNTVAESGVWRPETERDLQQSEVSGLKSQVSKCKAAWGFSALVELGGKVVLFDTGGDPEVLKHNVEALGVDLSKVDAIVISHEHWDHAGGLSYALSKKADPKIYVPSGVASKLAAVCPAPAELVELAEPREIFPGISTSGTLRGPADEHGLVLETPKGRVLVTGCAHPGVVELAKTAKGSGDKLYLVLGGFHMGGMSADRIDEIVAQMQKLTQKAAPCHCTGEEATKAFAAAFGSDFVRVGAGLRLEISASK